MTLPVVNSILSRLAIVWLSLGCALLAADEREKSRALNELIRAAREGRTAAVLAQVEAGADLHAHNELGYSVLAGAIMGGQWDTVEMLLESGFTPNRELIIENYPVQAGWTALSAAVLKNRPDLVQRLLDAGVKPDDRNRTWSSFDPTLVLPPPVLAAVDAGLPDMISMLARYGADLRVGLSSPNEPLRRCIAKKDLRMLRTLLEHGVQVNDIVRTGSFPIVMATIDGWREGIRELIVAGADPFRQRWHGEELTKTAFESTEDTGLRTFLWETGVEVALANKSLSPAGAAVYSAIWKKDYDVLASAVKAPGINESRLFGRCPLCFALNRRDEQAATLVIEAGKPSDFTSNPDVLDLMVAASSLGYARVVSPLLSAGVDPLQRDSSGWTALGRAAQNGHLPLLRMFVAKGAKLSAAQPGESTPPIAFAAWLGNVEMARYVLANGGGADEVDKEGNTALHWAAKAGHVEFMTLLLDAGTKIDHRNKQGESAFTLAALKGKFKAVELLLQRGVRDEYVMSQMRERKVDSAVVDLVAKFHGKAPPPMTHSEFFSQPRTVEELARFVERGADVNFLDEYTALQRVLQRPQVELAKWLLEHGADPKLTGKGERRGALYIAIDWTAKDEAEALELTRLLLAKGVDANHIVASPMGKPVSYHPPLNAAVRRGFLSVVKLLLENGADPRLRVTDPNAVNNNAMDMVQYAYALTPEQRLSLNRMLHERANQLSAQEEKAVAPKKKPLI